MLQYHLGKEEKEKRLSRTLLNAPSGNAAKGNAAKAQDKPSQPKTDDETEKLLKANPGKVESRLMRKLEKLAKSLELSEERSDSVKEKLKSPQAASDYQELMRLQKELESEEEEQEKLLIRIMETEEELENVREIIGKKV